jgi:FkbM family methyltransferase
MKQSSKNWLDSMRWQVTFYQSAPHRRRTDPEFDWPWFNRSSGWLLPMARRVAKHMLRRVGLRSAEPISVEWLEQNSELLWGTRSLLVDDLSKLLFDQSLVLRLTSHAQFYFPRIDYDDMCEITHEENFASSELPTSYLGLPLKVYDVRLTEKLEAPPVKIVTTTAQMHLLNSYRQYLVRRNSIDLSPVAGDVVIDCGACIGEVSLLFAGLVGTTGEVHLFDPVPLHTRFCHLQGSLNPILKHVLRVNTLAVSDRTHSISGAVIDSNKIDPGGLKIDSFSSVTLDDYVAENKLTRIDFIKMDIEGAEMNALAGAASVIRRFKPRLAISAYHKPDDLWKIADKIRSLNSNYQLYFGHHSPVQWESVIYAVSQ